MNFDERLERLADRHEALAQSLKLIARMQMKTEEAQLKNEILIGQVLESIDSLARIAHAHETRITNIDARRQ